MKSIGIIIPIYNVKKFLNECLSSFLRQTSLDFHCYLIDDGSTDGSSDIATDYATKYPDLFTYHRQENRGLGGARNTGLKLAKEKYVMFFDSDDFTCPKTIENILDYLKENKVDILLLEPTIYDCLTEDYYEWYDSEFLKEIFKNNKYVNVKSHPEVLTLEANMCRQVWDREFLKKNDFKFEEKIKWEDIYPHFFIFSKAKTIGLLEYYGCYYYRINSGGNQITSGTGATRLDFIKVFSDSVALAKRENWNKEMYAYLIRTMQNYFIWTVNVIDKMYRLDFLKGMHEIYRSIPLKYFRSYRKLKCPYQHYRKRYFIARIERSVFYKLFDNDKFMNLLNKIFKKINKILKRKK